MRNVATILMLAFCSQPAMAQVDESQAGAWYMYFFNAPLRTARGAFKATCNIAIGI